jgi:xylulokinase
VYLGIDIGTSSVKAVLVDGKQRLAAQREAPLAVSRPAPLWSEQDPDDWWQAVDRVVHELRGHSGSAWQAIESIGLSGQMHGAVVLGADDRPLRPAILGNDGRSAAECAELERCWPALAGVTGNRAMPGFTAPKLLWLSRHEPDVFRACRRVLLPKDYVRLRMTGEAASDLSDSAGTLWLDVGRRAWSEDALDATGLSLQHMPRLHEGCEPTGRLSGAVAQAWALPRRPIVAAGAGDNAAGAVGIGVIGPGEAFASLGTSGVTFVASDRYAPNPAGGVHTFCHALPGRWHQMAVHLSAASCLAWLAGILGAREPELLAELADEPAAPRGLFFAPYLSGERTPHNDPHAVAQFHGLTAATGRRDLVQAVLEGVAYAFRDGLDAIAATGTSLDRLSLIGGGSRSRYWAQVMADVLGVALDLRAGAEVGPAFGAARLARLAATREAPADVCLAPPLVETVEPRRARTGAYLAARPGFRSLYEAQRSRLRAP